MIDLRSDTVTRPSEAMLKAMSQAQVGDAVWGDDPTVKKLEMTMAKMAGMEAGLFFPSGTQSNLAGLMAHCERGDEYLVGQQAHTYKFEGGGAAILGSIQPQPIEHAIDGSLPLDKLEGAIKPVDIHFARTKLLALENTIGGKVLSIEYMRDASDLARRYDLGVHLDGARIFNALTESDHSLKEVCTLFDSVSICFSKGLGAPVGSVLLGSRVLIEKANRWRKVLGGGMRQTGILAAACLYALEHNIKRLADDHANAHYLAQALSAIPQVTSVSQATNIVQVEFLPSICEGLGEYLKSKQIIAIIQPKSRFVTHLDISRAQIDEVVREIRIYCQTHAR